MTKLVVHSNVDIAAAAAVVLETPTAEENMVSTSAVLADNSPRGTAADAGPTADDDDSQFTGDSPAPADSSQQLQMKEPHISMLYEKEDVMVKHFGVTQEQALRTQALLRLGVTDEDVRIAERLMASRSSGDNTQSKAEWLLGYTHAQMSYHKALEVLGVSEAVVEEDRTRVLQLEEVCQSQQNRIEQLESQLATLSAKSR